MNGGDIKVLNKFYKNIERPYANIDLSKIKSWDIVMNIMEQQAHEARRQMAKFLPHDTLVPQTICDFHHSSYNGNNSTEDNSDASSYYSDEIMSDSTTNSSSDRSQNDSDIEIDVDSIESESDEEFIPSLDDIPVTVLQFETKLREKDLKRK